MHKVLSIGGSYGLSSTDMARIGAAIKTAEDALKGYRNVSLSMVLGNVGCGKSTTITSLLGNPLHKVKHNRRTVLESDVKDGPVISHSVSKSGTLQLGLFPVSGRPFLLCDTPGFGDTRGSAVDIQNAIMNMAAMRVARDIRAIYCMSYSSLRIDRARLFFNALHQLKDLLNSKGSISQSFMLVFTKPYNEDGDIVTVEEIKEHLRELRGSANESDKRVLDFILRGNGKYIQVSNPLDSAHQALLMDAIATLKPSRSEFKLLLPDEAKLLLARYFEAKNSQIEWYRTVISEENSKIHILKTESELLVDQLNNIKNRLNTRFALQAIRLTTHTIADERHALLKREADLMEEFSRFSRLLRDRVSKHSRKTSVLESKIDHLRRDESIVIRYRDEFRSEPVYREEIRSVRKTRTVYEDRIGPVMIPTMMGMMMAMAHHRVPVEETYIEHERESVAVSAEHHFSCGGFRIDDVKRREHNGGWENEQHRVSSYQVDFKGNAGASVWAEVSVGTKRCKTSDTLSEIDTLSRELGNLHKEISKQEKILTERTLKVRAERDEIQRETEKLTEMIPLLDEYHETQKKVDVLRESIARQASKITPITSALRKLVREVELEQRLLGNPKTV